MGSDAGDRKVAVTFKGTAGSGAPWIKVHAASLDEALDMFQGDAKLASMLDRVQLAVQNFTDDRDR